MNNGLVGKSIYAFGDSIVYGHVYPAQFRGRSFRARGDGPHQVRPEWRDHRRRRACFRRADTSRRSSKRPTSRRTSSSSTEASMMRSPFSGTARTRSAPTWKSWRRRCTSWGGSGRPLRIVYVAAHKLGSRDWDTQVALREVTLQACRKWNIAVADVFGETTFDTRDDTQRAKYTFDDLVNGFPGTEGSGTHPNEAGIATFYVPVVSAKLQHISHLTSWQSDLPGRYRPGRSDSSFS